MSEILTRSELGRQLPCRDKLIVCDQVCIESEKKVVGYKAVSLGEWYFMGHFPGHPIMPGVLQVEAFAQLAELLVWKKLDPERKNDVYLKASKKIKFRRPNNPGDRILFTVEQTGETSDSFDFTCTACNNGGPSCQALITLGVRPRVKLTELPKYNSWDKTDKSALDVSHIMDFIPHRYPFLLVDYVSKIEAPTVYGVKNACSDEATFRCYADGYRVMTGSVHPEIAAQAGCIYVLARPENKGKIAYFIGIDNTEYLRPVLPGDQLQLKVDMPDAKSRFGKGKGFIYVNDEVATSSEIMFALIAP